MPVSPPSPCTISTVAASMNGMQSHSTLPLRRAQQQRALPDGELRHRPDPDQARLVLPEAIEMPPRQRVERGPALAAGRNELPLVAGRSGSPGGGSIRWA